MEILKVDVMGTIIALIVVVVLLLILWGSYNRLVKLRNQIENSISSTDALFIKRSDLIPNLIATAQKYASFEQETLEKVISLRGMNSQTSPVLEKKARMVLDSFMVQVERYPELKTNQQFLNLQYNMTEVEEQISAGRRYISTSITEYNDAVKVFPSNVIAGVLGFKEYKWQYATEEQRQNVNAKELFDN